MSGSIIIIALLLGVILYLAVRLYKAKRQFLQQSSQSRQFNNEKKVIFDFLHDLGETLSEEIDRRQLLNKILECSVRVSNAASGIIYIKHASSDKLVAESIHGLFPPPIMLAPEVESKMASRPEYLATILRNEAIHIRDQGNIISTIFNSGNPIWIADAEDDTRFPKTSIESLQLRSLIAVPLKFRDEILGVMALANHINGTNFTLTEFEVAKSVATQASFALYNANVYSILAEKQRLDRDLETAHEIQRIMLPASCPEIPGYQIAAINKAAQRVSGDYYDFLKIDDTHLGIVIADVSGKGVPASLIMAMCRTVMRTEAVNCHSAAEVLRKVNRTLHPDIREDMFITLAYLILNTEKNTLTIAKAGHDAPLLCTDNNQRIDVLQSPGMALGIDNGEVFDNVLQDLVVELKQGDMVLVYTDGVNEAIDSEGQEFGREQIKTVIKSAAPNGVDTVIDTLVDRVSRFTGGAPQNDDITIVALQRK